MSAFSSNGNKALKDEFRQVRLGGIEPPDLLVRNQVFFPLNYRRELTCVIIPILKLKLYFVFCPLFFACNLLLTTIFNSPEVFGKTSLKLYQGLWGVLLPRGCNLKWL